MVDELFSVDELRAVAPTTLPMYNVSQQLRPVADALGMDKHFQEMREKGYTVLQPTEETIRLADEIRSEVRELLRDQKKNGDPRHGAGTPRLLGRGKVGPDGRTAFERYLMLPQQAALAEYMCGAGFILSQMTASIKTAKMDAAIAKATGVEASPQLHADQSWMPSPYPEHNMMLTACFVTDDSYETRDGGATCIVPGSHRLRQAPPHDKAILTKAYRNLTPILAPKGSIVCWDGLVWHAGGFRKVQERERIVMHTTFSRLYVRPVENYKLTVPDEILKRNLPLMATMCGRSDFLDHTLKVDPEKLMATYGMAHAGHNSVAELLGDDVPWRLPASKL